MCEEPSKFLWGYSCFPFVVTNYGKATFSKAFTKHTFCTGQFMWDYIWAAGVWPSKKVTLHNVNWKASVVWRNIYILPSKKIFKAYDNNKSI